MFDILVVGCGFSGAAAARLLAQRGKKVLILEKREHIAGNMYDSTDENGVLTHRYGPHIFHTDNEAVYSFLSKFTDFLPYRHKVQGMIDNCLVPIPFNFRSFDLLYGSRSQEIKALLRQSFPKKERVSVLDLLNCGNRAVREAGQFVYEKVFVHYTAKQWGIPPEKVDKSVINRVPVVLGYNDGYFANRFQEMPSKGYTKLFERMLGHPLIKVELGCDALSRLKPDCGSGKLTFDGEELIKPVIYTGASDELFGRRFGALPYRSLRLDFERLQKTHFQPAAVVNYPGNEPFTRITEFKYLTGQRIEGKTTILREYPMAYDPDGENIPYYPVVNGQNAALYEKYRLLAGRFGNLYLCGRLGQYRYYNMDAAVDAAMKLVETIPQ